jgi:hypothetical protein
VGNSSSSRPGKKTAATLALVPPVRPRHQIRKRKDKRSGVPKSEQARLTEARAIAFELRKQGQSYRQIGAALKVSVTTAYEYIMAELMALREQTAEDVTSVREMELQRCDEMMAGLWKFAVKGDVASVATVLRVMERRSRLLGLDAPTKQEVLGALVSITPEEAAKLSDDELKDRIAALANRVAVTKPLAIEAIAVKVE